MVLLFLKIFTLVCLFFLFYLISLPHLMLVLHQHLNYHNVFECLLQTCYSYISYS